MTAALEIPPFLDRRGGTRRYEFHPAADIFPMLEGEAFEALVEDIRQNGLREPIWLHQDGRILDGRNRYRACQRTDTAPRFQTYAGPEDGIVAFVVSLNLHRRHLNESQRAMVAARVATMNQGARTDLAPIGAMSQPQAAEQLSVSRTSLQRAKKVADNGSEKLAKAVERGEILLADAVSVIALPQDQQDALVEKVQDGTFSKLKNAKPKAAIDQQREAIESGAVVMPEGLFEVIVVDPPWPYTHNKYDPDFKRVVSPYPSMTMEALKSPEIPAAETSILWLWATNSFMPEACSLLEAWRFELRTILTWVKPHIGLGSWLRNRTEHCLLATKGNPRVDLRAQSTVLEAPAQEHSRKPDEFYKLVEGLCIGRKLDYFSREKRPGWSQVGNEPRKFGGGS